MKRGKYEAPRRTNPLAVFFFIILFLFLILGTILICQSCNQAEYTPDSTPKSAVSQPDQTQAPQSTVTTPATQPVAPPVTEPPTEPPTEPNDELPTEPPADVPTDIPADPEEDVTPDTENTLGAKIVATAKSALGKPYAQGGTGPDSFDTSGFVNYCFREHSITVPRSTRDQFEKGEAVAKESLQPGDVVFFYSSNPGKAEYVGIYVGDNTFIAVSTSQNKVMERKINSSYYTEHFVGARRYIPAQTPIQ